MFPISYFCALLSQLSHAGLLLALFPLSILRAQGCCFDFYDVIVLRFGSMFFPYALTNGLYFAEVFAVAVESSLSEPVVLPVPIEPSASVQPDAVDILPVPWTFT